MNNNPQAFPREQYGPMSDQPGMTLRDYFAGQALPTVLQGNIYDEDGYAVSADMRPASYAADAYRIADAMLAQRTKGDAA